MKFFKTLLTLLIASSTMMSCAMMKADDARNVRTTANHRYHSPFAGPRGPQSGNPILPANFTPQKFVRVSRVEGVGNHIALTFDDGPDPVDTPRLLDILRQRNIKATFYVIGSSVNRHPEIARRIVAEGHEIGNHTQSHPNLAKMSTAAVRRELDSCRLAIIRATGVQPRTMRPPYGAIRSEQRHWINRDYGYPSVMWDVDPLDWKDRNASLVEQRILRNTTAGSIVLAHDIHTTTIDAMPRTIDQLLARGYRFVTVSQLLAMGERNGYGS